MAPKPRPVVRRTSVTGLGAVKATPAPTTGPVNPGKPLASMLPPPVPVPAQGILEREARALETVLQVSMYKDCNVTVLSNACAERHGQDGEPLCVPRGCPTFVRQILFHNLSHAY
jgi:hypothetical protein